ncbi:hypothetical protein Q8A73_011195 [Channa argus]|nr:hypothetical protein Q8A73_011195 [Channa argus]
MKKKKKMEKKEKALTGEQGLNLRPYGPSLAEPTDEMLSLYRLFCSSFAATLSHLFSHQTASIANCTPSLCGESSSGSNGETSVPSHLQNLFISTLHTCTFLVVLLVLQDSLDAKRQTATLPDSHDE